MITLLFYAWNTSDIQKRGHVTRRRGWCHVICPPRSVTRIYERRSLLLSESCGIKQLFHVRVFSGLAWLSSRPEFKQSVANFSDPHLTPPANAREQQHRQEKYDRLIRSAEDFFVESLEAWRRVHGIPTMILAGHSMGGYIGVAYAERYPQHVERLILLSPAGVTAGDEQRVERIQRARQQSLWFRMLSSTWLALYNWNTTVGHLLRLMPNERAQRMISNYVEKRLPALTDQDERKAVADYLYLNNTLPGSGEYCVHALLTPMLDGRRPTETRIPHLREPSISFLYGSHDWMDIAGGLRVQARTEANNSKDVSVYRVRNAGHLLMLDNWEEVNVGVVLACGGKLADPTHAPERLVPTAEHYRTASQREIVVAAQPDVDARVAPKNQDMEVAT